MEYNFSVKSQVFPITPVIYKITCKANNKIYIGSAINFRRRFKKHRCELNTGKHANLHMLRSFQKYGIESFFIEIIEDLDINLTTKEIRDKEQYYIDKFNSKVEGFNITDAYGFTPFEQLSSESQSKVIENQNQKKKKVMLFNKDTGEFFKEFDSCTSAATEIGSTSSNVSRTCMGKLKYVKGYVAIYSIDYIEGKDYKYIRPKKVVSEETKEKMRKGNCRAIKVIYTNLLTNTIKEFDSKSECERFLELPKEFLRTRLTKDKIYETETYMLRVKDIV